MFSFNTTAKHVVGTPFLIDRYPRNADENLDLGNATKLRILSGYHVNISEWRLLAAVVKKRRVVLLLNNNSATAVCVQGCFKVKRTTFFVHFTDSRRRCPINVYITLSCVAHVCVDPPCGKIRSRFSEIRI